MNNALATHAAVTEQSTRLLIASTILEQLGGVRRLSVMTGARDFVALPDGVQFKIGAGAKLGANKARIILTPEDVYTVEFWKIRGAKCELISISNYIYNDMLSRVFEQETGFSLTL